MGSFDRTETLPLDVGDGNRSPAVTGSAPRLAGAPVGPDDRLGRYTIRRHLGGGGMGEVFAAHDPELDREVAIKLIREGLLEESPEARARFRREARALARLNHPNVVSVHDVGAVGSMTFVAMELVEGPTLQSWLQARPRGWREVVDVFLQAGRGLQAAHDAGMVHRDFKPSNVIVGDRVRVVDFGLARRAYTVELASGSGEKPPLADVTQTGEMIGTPAYMAPEQKDQPIASPLADQYSFGLALHDALAGGRGETLPSTVPRWLRALVARTQHVRPEERFGSMAELLAELSRGAARSPQAWLLVGGAAVAALAFGFVGWQRAAAPPPCRAGEARIAGVWDEAAQKKVHTAFLATGRSSAEASFERVDRALRERQAAWARAHDDVCAATAVRHEQSSALLDLRMQCLASARVEMDTLVDKLAAADVTMMDWAAVAAPRAGNLDACNDLAGLQATQPLPRDPDALREVQTVRQLIVDHDVLVALGKTKDALARGPALVERARKADHRPTLAKALVTTGKANIGEGGDTDAGIELLYEGVRESSLAHDDALVASALSELAFAQGSRKQRFELSDATYRLAETAVARAGATPVLVRGLLNYRGHVLTKRGDAQAAFLLRNAVLALSSTIYGPDSYQTAMTLGYLASNLTMLGRPHAARPLYDRALAVLEKSLGGEHSFFLSTLTNASTNRRDTDDLDGAGAMLERALAVQERNLGPESAALTGITLKLAELRYVQWRLPEAQAFAERSRAVTTARKGAEHGEVGDAEVMLGQIAARAGRHEEARAHFAKGLAILEKAFGPEHYKVSAAIAEDARSLLALGRVAEARKAADEALAIDRKLFDEREPDLALSQSALADVLVVEGAYAEAEALYRKSLALLEVQRGPDSPILVEDLVGLCTALARRGARDDAKRVAARAEQLAARGPAPLLEKAKGCAAGAK